MSKEEKTKAREPRVPEAEIKKLEDQFDKIDHEIKDLNMDRMALAPKEETESQTKMALADIDKTPKHYLKPARSIGVQQKFNEKFREQWNFDKEYVQFIAENKEAEGEIIEMWTHPYGGVPAEFWQIPSNVPVWAPRHVAEQLRRRSYRRLIMEEQKMSGSDGMGQYYGRIAVEKTVNRLDARPVTTRRSVFMGARDF